MFISQKLNSLIFFLIFIIFISCKKDTVTDPVKPSIVITPDAPVTDFDGNSYKTIKIGDQIWMAENLRSTHYSDGVAVDHYIYNKDTANIKIYGRLYASEAAMRYAGSSNTNPSNVQGIAPQGWHLPSKAEWEQLANYLGGLDVAGGKMKDTGVSLWISPNTGATNESMFAALPAGIYNFTGDYQWIKTHCAFSSSTKNPSQNGVTAIMLQTTDSKMTIGNFHPDDGVSVRCIKNKP